jgi:deazaflavin-dependent oxidoreductase (nitroreductase family)
MSVAVTPRGSRGTKLPRAPIALAMMRFANHLMFLVFKNRRFQNANLMSLTTVGARTGQERRTTVVYFPEPDGSVLIVGSAGGTATHPAWFFNLAKHPDRVWAQMGNRRLKVRPATLSGETRAAAWQRITQQSPGFAGYEEKTDREIPVIRLTPE